MNTYEQAAEDLGANEEMVRLIKSGTILSSSLDAFEEAVMASQKAVDWAIENGEISRLVALQAQKRGGDQVRKDARNGLV
jgi:hypothetical protein